LASSTAQLSRPGDETAENVQRDYAVLKRRINDAGLMEKRPLFYAFSITTNLALFFGCIAVLFLVKEVWAQALTAVFLGLISGQL
jgi:Flp pilus assembly protein TadB